ncbi:MAG TPA: ABC transporter permease [Pseudonocardia sp.]|jgi:phospholipid/cholesterol/gamma-HCH transport system permease protein|nr:ABC transporter permease [Pseudonocardia sp.]
MGNQPDEDEHEQGFISFALAGVASFFQQLGEMFELLVRLVVVFVRRPVGFWGDVYAQMFETLRTSWLLLAFSTFVFGFGAPGLQGAASFQRLGMQDRLGMYFVMAGVRGFVPWLNAIVIAGVVGTRLIAELGSRRVRQEFDALEVMGIDPVHDVILPRVIGLTVMTALLSVLAMALGISSGVAAAAVTGASPASFLEQFWTAVSTADMLAALGKAALFGLVISVVCAHMGYRAEGGPTGVGRAVNVGVVSAFAGVWLTNLVITTLLFSFHPELHVGR